MSFEEKMTWSFMLLLPLMYGIYVAVILGRADGLPLDQVAYAGPMLWSMGGMILASVAAAVAIAASAPGECDRKDERDRAIHRYGEYVGQTPVAVTCLAAILLCMVQAAHFWIANTLFLGCVLSGLVSAATKLHAYRRGLPWC